MSHIVLDSREEEAKLFPKISRKKPFDGIILAAVRSSSPLVSRLLDSKVPVVLHGRHDDSRASFVDVDNIAGAVTAVTYLVRLGRSRIATIAGPEDSLAAQDRRLGYTQALRSRGFPLDETLVANGDFTEVSGYENMQRLLPLRPDSVFVASDTMALGALRAIREAGLTVPDDIAIVGFDDLPHAVTADPPLTTVRQPIRQAGVVVVETLLDMLESGSEPPRRIVLPTELIVRASCGGASAVNL
jgi:LacI family transcriptional regulator